MSRKLINRREVLGSMAGAAALAMGADASHAVAPATARLLVVGDWGRNGASHQRDVAVQMGKAAQAGRCQGVISVGDNFYEDGVESANDPQWQSSFEAVYSAPSLQVPWYVALGNHDYRGLPQAQVDYSKISPRWRMPSRYFKVSGVSLGAPQLDLFVIDTSPLVHKYREDVHSQIAQNVASQDTNAQLRWLDEQLGDSTAEWKLVIGHHTIYSGGSGHGDTPETQQLIEPLLRKHHVRAYINGHDHDMQHLRRDSVDYVCCGAGSEVRPVEAVIGTLFCRSVSGFAVIDCKPDVLNIEFRDYTGQRLYQSALAGREAAVKVA